MFTFEKTAFLLVDVFHHALVAAGLVCSTVRVEVQVSDCLLHP